MRIEYRKNKVVIRTNWKELLQDENFKASDWQRTVNPNDDSDWYWLHVSGAKVQPRYGSAHKWMVIGGGHQFEIFKTLWEAQKVITEWWTEKESR
jgi:hypothetical protein